jgi:small subunit ribosomal protein S18
MAQNESEIRYLTPPTVEIKKKKYCRFKKNRIRYIDYKDPEFLKKFCHAELPVLHLNIRGKWQKPLKEPGTLLFFLM